MYNAAKEQYIELMDSLVENLKTLETLMESDDFIEWANDSQDEEKPQFRDMTSLLDALNEMKEDYVDRAEHEAAVHETLEQMVASGEVAMSVDDNGEILYTLNKKN